MQTNALWKCHAVTCTIFTDYVVHFFWSMVSVRPKHHVYQVLIFFLMCLQSLQEPLHCSLERNTTFYSYFQVKNKIRMDSGSRDQENIEYCCRNSVENEKCCKAKASNRNTVSNFNLFFCILIFISIWWHLSLGLIKSWQRLRGWQKFTVMLQVHGRNWQEVWWLDRDQIKVEVMGSYMLGLNYEELVL